MIAKLVQGRWLHSRWSLLVAILAYCGYLSYAVADLLNSSLSARQRLVVTAGWVFALVCLAVFAGLLATRGGDKIFDALVSAYHSVQTWQGRWRGLVFVGLIVLSALLVYTDVSRGLMDNDRFRYATLFIPLVFACLFFPFREPKSGAGRCLITLLASAFALLSGDYLQSVVSYPFSLHWSEGNRFYDYSLTFGKNLYQYDGQLSLPYFAPGRYGLWGIWFLIPGLPIAFHRFWDAFLWTAPPLLLGWLLGRSLSRHPGLRLGLAVWLALFLSQGPIYAPLLLAAALVAGSDRAPLWVRYPMIALASLYAGLSRWTWFATAGAWAALLELTTHESEPRRPLLRRLASAVGLFLAGSLPGVLANWTQLTAPKDIAFPLSQPKLWYRLWPNPTLSTGIVPGLALATVPLLVILVWLVLTKRWRLDWLQLAAIGALLVATLGVGLVASVKIGGGSNLHNLDMFLISLGFLVMVYLDHAANKASLAREGDDPAVNQVDDRPVWMQSWPVWVKGVVVVALLLIVYPRFSEYRRLKLPPQSEVQRSLENLRAQVARFQSQGEVLFLDQRQLLTFGEIQGVPLIPDYEKKYLMDQAMASNAEYFRGFYEDIANKRFALIVSEPLFESYDDEYSPFSEENNAWVTWVSTPVLCYYKTERLYRPVRVELLVPREGSKNCPLAQP